MRRLPVGYHSYVSMMVVNNNNKHDNIADIEEFTSGISQSCTMMAIKVRMIIKMLIQITYQWVIVFVYQ